MNLLILLIGGNPIANYALIEYFKNNGDDKIPKCNKVMLVYTNKTQIVAENIKKLQHDIGFIDVNLEDKESNLEFIKNEILKKLNNLKITSIHLNYTGGRKPMSIGAYLAVKDYENDCQKIYTDINPQTYKLTLSDGSTYLSEKETISSKLQIPIENFYILHNLEKPKYKNSISQFYNKDFCKFLLEQKEKNEKEFFTNLWDKKINELKKLDWKNSIKEYINKIPKEYSEENISNKKLEKLQKFIRGGWLEEYLFDILTQVKNKANITDLAYNVISKNKGAEFEVDVVAINGYKSFIFSCTTDKKAHIKQKGFEVAQKAEQIGGRMANAILISLAENKIIEKIMKDLHHIEKKFKAIGIEDIKDEQKFIDKLKQLLQ